MELLDGDEKTDVSVLQIIERKRRKIPTFSLIHASFVSFIIKTFFCASF